MQNKDHIRRWAIRLMLMLFDVVAVNLAYFLALVLRFYVNHTFIQVSAKYLPRFAGFAPYYTVCCLIVFWLLKLYSGIWRYAGLNDLNRIVLASVITGTIHVAGTLLIVGRMPITYYALGAFIQFVFVCISRFSYRIFAMEFYRYAKSRNNAAINLMIVGVGETARIYMRQINDDKENLAHPVCMADWRNQIADGLMDGLPVVGSLEKMRDAIGKYDVKVVVIADSLMPKDMREKTRKLCGELGVSVQDFSGYTQHEAVGVDLNRLLEVIDGPVELVNGEERRSFDNGEQAAMNTPGKYLVKALSAKEGVLAAEIEQNVTSVSTVTAAWAQKYEAETGEKVSFF